MKTVLIAGFEPFGGEKTNPSQEIASRLDGRVVGGCRVAGVTLPCGFGKSIVELRRRIRATRPVLVICLGQAGGRAGITPERVAINVDDARIPDNEGVRRVDMPVVKGGPAACWSTLPIKAIVRALEKKGIPSAVSQTAGTFVCNHVFYGLMHGLRRSRVRGGFIHVPFLPEQARRRKGAPSLPLDTMVAAIATAIEVSLKVKRDVRVPGGAEA